MMRCHVRPHAICTLVGAVLFIALVLPLQSDCLRIVPEHGRCIEECWFRHKECLQKICTKDAATLEAGMQLCVQQRKRCLKECFEDIFVDTE
ncbi:hypothetical protein NP493_1469g00006 [Ridgeia piscesae]|uniref:Uncharacterized protein n=1 Tax=Ridgeia piscesae TaxID=27915 RepID=A0AAD9K3J9_RIDPI|nr:hypothetical protein NP493_1469g00006 [Ridgeia piscesae]